MPDNDKAKNVGLFRRIADRINSNSDELYKSTYYSSTENKDQLTSIKNDINSSIKNIVTNNMDNVGEPNISKLFERLLAKQNDKETVAAFEDIFGDNEFVSNLTNSYLDNRWVKAVDFETDEVLRYMPKLQEALNTIRDNVLSADSFNKDYLSLENDIATGETKFQFDRNIQDLKDKYKLLKLTSDIFDKTSKYGETFVYCVPYKQAIERLMRNKDSYKTIHVKTSGTMESAINITESVSDIRMNEAFTDDDISRSRIINESSSIKISDYISEKDEQFSMNLDISVDAGIIRSVVESERKSRDKKKFALSESLTEQFFAEQATNILDEDSIDLDVTGRSPFANTFNDELSDAKLPTHHNFDHVLHDDLPLPDDVDPSSDGLIDRDSRKSERLNDMNGCIVKILKRERITPIILNDVCLGYYYFEYDTQQELFEERFATTGIVNTITGLRSNGRSEAFDSQQRREELLRNIASNLADRIDTKFINDNQDLKKEIYYILKYNDQFNTAINGTNNIKVSYISPEDIQHIYFDLNEDTSRGISDLDLALIPAKLWVAIYITNCLAVMTRGNDKRVYYVRQSVETNISKTLLKTINEIKKSNFGIRQIENINSVLNITGRFNDYIIPRSADGQSPIEFEIMQGQNVEIKTELLNLLEESAINITGVPLELIQARMSPDYALQLTMSNSKFLRFVYSRQSRFQELMCTLYSRIYNIEYGTNNKIKLTLPPPLFINVTNTNQLVTNTNDYCDNVTNIVLADEQDETVKQLFAKKFKLYNLGTYANIDVINRLINEAKQEATMKRVSNTNIEGEE